MCWIRWSTIHFEIHRIRARNKLWKHRASHLMRMCWHVLVGLHRSNVDYLMIRQRTAAWRILVGGQETPFHRSLGDEAATGADFHWSGSVNPPDDGDASDWLVTAGSADHVFHFLHQVEGKKQKPNDLPAGSDRQRPPGADLAVYSFRTRTLPPAVCAQWPKTVTGARYCMFFFYIPPVNKFSLI